MEQAKLVSLSFKNASLYITSSC